MNKKLKVALAAVALYLEEEKSNDNITNSWAKFGRSTLMNNRKFLQNRGKKL